MKPIIIENRRGGGYYTGQSPLPYMLPNEIALFDSILSNTRRYVEWGSGNSTLFVALNYRLEGMVTIETNEALVDELKRDPYLSKLAVRGKLELIHANIGHTVEWGWPSNRDPTLAVGAMWQDLCEKLPEDIDTVLIDGRYRIPAVLLSLMLWPEATFLFHDFTNRTHYHNLCEYIDIQEVCDTLIVFKAKKSVKSSQIFRAFIANQFIPD